MKIFIFLSAEGFTYQPNSSSVEPDIDNLQVIGFAKGNSAEEASKKLLDSNSYLAGSNFEEIFSIELASENREYFSLRNIVKAAHFAS